MDVKIIGMAADHGGYAMKEIVKAHLVDKGYEVVDFGTTEESSVDYPDYAAKLTKAVLEGAVDKGIAVCGTGIGISIACNRVKGIRAALCGDTYSAKACRQHNDANILCLGGRVIGIEVAKDIVDTFFAHDFDGGRHQTRIDKIERVEEL